MKQPASKSPAPSTPPYQSNPFLLAFQSLSKLFTHNLVWGIILLALGILGAIAQFIQSFANLLLSGGPSSSTVSTTSTASSASSSPDAGVIVAIIIVVTVFVLVAVVLGTAIGVFIQGLFSYVTLKSLEGKAVSAEEAFQAVFKRYWRLLGAQLLAMLKIFGWTLLLIVPGIIAGFRYALLTYVIMDQPATEKGVGASHTRVKSLVKGRLFEVFGIATVAAVVPFIGEILRYTGNGALYRQLQVYHDGQLAKPNVHWLNYLGLILLGLLLLFLLGIVLLLTMVSLR